MKTRLFVITFKKIMIQSGNDNSFWSFGNHKMKRKWLCSWIVERKIINSWLTEWNYASVEKRFRLFA